MLYSRRDDKQRILHVSLAFRPLRADFIDSNFQESEKSLFWEGFIDSVLATIIISFPFPIAHCHLHVWRE